MPSHATAISCQHHQTPKPAPCSIMESMLHHGIHAPSWNPCSVMDSMLHHGLHAPSWTPCSIMDSMLHHGLHAPSWNPCSIMESMFHHGIHAPSWTPCSMLPSSQSSTQSFHSSFCNLGTDQGSSNRSKHFTNLSLFKQNA